jgi:glyceraldehyde-3-phosphate dehydrogenase (NAD(P))
VLVRCATDPDKARKGVVNGAMVEAGRSHHADDLRQLLPGLELYSQAMAVPMRHGHVASLAVRLELPASSADVRQELAATPRMRLEGGNLITAALRSRFAGRPRGDRPELVVLKDSIATRGDQLFLSAVIHMESIIVPETVDCVRAISTTGLDQAACMRRTDQALSIAKPARCYERRLCGRPTAVTR